MTATNSRHWPWAYLVAAIFAFSLLPTTAHACFYCNLSGFYLANPYLDSGLIIFGTWRILYAAWQYYHYRPTFESLHKPLCWRMGAWILLMFWFLHAGILIYLFASFAHALVDWVFSFQRDSGVSKKEKAMLLAMQIATVIVFVPFAQRAYAERAQLDDLGRLARYVYPGTASSRATIQHRILKDPDFDVERLRPLLLSESHRLRDIAFEVLHARKKPEDILRFWDIIAEYEDRDFELWTPHIPRFGLWIREVCGYDVKTMGRLRGWVLERFPDAFDDRPTTQPPNSRTSDTQDLQ